MHRADRRPVRDRPSRPHASRDVSAPGRARVEQPVDPRGRGRGVLAQVAFVFWAPLPRLFASAPLPVDVGCTWARRDSNPAPGDHDVVPDARGNVMDPRIPATRARRRAPGSRTHSPVRVPGDRVHPTGADEGAALTGKNERRLPSGGPGGRATPPRRAWAPPRPACGAEPSSVKGPGSARAPSTASRRPGSPPA